MPLPIPIGIGARTRIKYCGVTRQEDWLRCQQLGIDYVGFNFSERSSRRVLPSQAKEILGLDLTASADAPIRVGVFVDQTPAEIKQALESFRLSVLQLHGQEMPSDLEELPRVPLIKAFRWAGPGTMESIARYVDECKSRPVDLAAVLIDSGVGGTGETWDWSVKANEVAGMPMFLAGGLRPENVAKAVAEVEPFAVDVASGIESSPGVKDLDLMTRFRDAIHQI